LTKARYGGIFGLAPIFRLASKAAFEREAPKGS